MAESRSLSDRSCTCAEGWARAQRRLDESRAEVERLRAALRRIAEHGPSSARGWKHWADMAVDALAFDEEVRNADA